MANPLLKTLKRLGQPMACFGAVAAGCLLVQPSLNSAIAQEDVRSSTLDRIFTSEEIQITPMPPVNATSSAVTGYAPLTPLRQNSVNENVKPLPERQMLAPIDGNSGTESVQQIIGSMRDQQSQAFSRAQLVVPQTQNTNPGYHLTQPQVRTSQAPASRPVSKLNVSDRFQASQASFQESAGGNAAPTAQTPLAHVAEMKRERLETDRLTGLHQVTNLSMEEFESAVLSTWSTGLNATSSNDGRYVRVELPNRIGKRMAMLIDRQTKTLSYEGDASLQRNWHRIVGQLDYQPVVHNAGSRTALVHPGKAALQIVLQAASLMGFYQDEAAGNQVPTGDQEDNQPSPQDRLTLPPNTPVPPQGEILPGGRGAAQGLKNKVKIVEDPDTGMITLVGDKADLDIVVDIILKIAAESEAAQPQVARIALSNIQSEAFAEQIQELYDDSYASSKGSAAITPIPSPNSLIVVAQPEGIQAVRNIVKEMDVESMDALDGSKTFQLKYISAADAKVRLDLFFGQTNFNQGDNQIPSAPVVTISDYRSNSITVKGSRQFIQEAERYLSEIDVSETAAANIVKVIQLRNALAEDVAIVLQDAINGQQPNAGQGFNPNQQLQQQTTNQGADIRPEESHLRSPALTLKTIGENGEVISSGILFDVRVTADRNSNSVVVSAPEASFALVEALVQQLDRIPTAESQIKVFQIFNGDAETLLSMLETLFQSGTQQQGGQGQAGTTNLTQLPLQAASATAGSTLINLRFSIDQRTNSIIASGPAGDLQVVEDLLNRLDAQDLNEKQIVVHRLSNAPVLDVAEAVNNWLDTRATILDEDPRAIGGLNQTNREVIVVPEVVSNSLIIQAQPQYLAEINEVVIALDRRPTMVKIKTLIAEVDLNRVEEFGVEIGLQDSLLFDRGTIIDATSNAITGGIGFPFNNPNSVANSNAINPAQLAGQALSNFATGRISQNVGYGGLVLSAGSQDVNVLLRALKDKRALRILNRPHIVTMENLQGRVIVGEEVARIGNVTNTVNGVTQDINYVDVGVILEVTPRVSPDGMIVLAINAKRSNVDPNRGQDIPFDSGLGGTTVVTIPNIAQSEANTTLMARSGQTVVFAGLIQEEKAHERRGTPVLSDIPVIGPLFQYEADEVRRKELLIIMTPYLINDADEETIDMFNNDEMERMHWCLCDVTEVYGATGYDEYNGDQEAIETYYPDSDPAGLQPQQYQQPGPYQIQAPVIDSPAPASIQGAR